MLGLAWIRWRTMSRVGFWHGVMWRMLMRRRMAVVAGLHLHGDDDGDGEEDSHF